MSREKQFRMLNMQIFAFTFKNSHIRAHTYAYISTKNDNHHNEILPKNSRNLKSTTFFEAYNEVFRVILSTNKLRLTIRKC